VNLFTLFVIVLEAGGTSNEEGSGGMVKEVGERISDLSTNNDTIIFNSGKEEKEQNNDDFQAKPVKKMAKTDCDGRHTSSNYYRWLVVLRQRPLRGLVSQW
jgi:hypothetical protein